MSIVRDVARTYGSRYARRKREGKWALRQRVYGWKNPAHMRKPKTAIGIERAIHRQALAVKHAYQSVPSLMMEGIYEEVGALLKRWHVSGHFDDETLTFKLDAASRAKLRK
jgi:hypothetical protein